MTLREVFPAGAIVWHRSDILLIKIFNTLILISVQQAYFYF